MEKSTITVGGVDYTVLTLDIRSLPGYEGEAYAQVTVADHNLSLAVEMAIKAGDYDACKIDDEIFFYADPVFINTDPSEEQIVDYLCLNLCNMSRNKPVSEPEAVDMYAIEQDEQGRKQISLLGFTYHGDNWKTIDVRGVCVPLDEFVAGCRESDDYVDTLYLCSREYERDVTDEQCVADINHFFGGKPADYRLPFSSVTIDTPIGNYINAA